LYFKRRLAFWEDFAQLAQNSFQEGSGRRAWKGFHWTVMGAS
jgi:hypothetical protein